MRVLAGLLVVAAFAVPSVHAVPASVVDRTLSCTVLQEGAAHHIEFRGSVVTPRASASFQFSPSPLAWDQPAVQPGVDIKTKPGSITWDARHACEPSKRRLPFSIDGLPQRSVVTTHFVGSTVGDCPASTRVHFRARITLHGGEPAHVQVLAVDGRTRRPLGLADWTPQRITLRLARSCHSSP
jgi:hypothetical protein